MAQQENYVHEGMSSTSLFSFLRLSGVMHCILVTVYHTCTEFDTEVALSKQLQCFFWVLACQLSENGIYLKQLDLTCATS